MIAELEGESERVDWAEGAPGAHGVSLARGSGIRGEASSRPDPHDGSERPRRGLEGPELSPDPGFGPITECRIIDRTDPGMDSVHRSSRDDS